MDVPYVELCHPINQVNADSIDRITSVAHESGCNGIRFTPVHNKDESLEAYELTPEQEEAIDQRLLDVKERLRDVDEGGVTICMVTHDPSGTLLERTARSPLMH